MTDRLRPLWDFDDLETTEQRFRALLATEQDESARAEILTQLARVYGLRDDFGAGEELLQQAERLASADARARVRIDLERGRLLRSAGDPAAAMPLFESAVERAVEAGELWIAADAAHMAAVAAQTPESRRLWTERGVELARSGDGSANYWLGPLLNNLGWDLHESGRFEEALDAFRQALEARRSDPENREATAIAHYAIGRALQSLGEHEDAITELRIGNDVWTASGGTPDGYSHEALAESCAALGKLSQAREHACLALELLPASDPSFATDDARVARLRALAGNPSAGADE